MARSGAVNAPGTGLRSWRGAPRRVLTRRSLPGDPADDQARYIEAAVSGVLVASIYLPNGNPQPGPKFAYKLAWFERLIAHAAELRAAGVPVVLAGDYNVVPTEADIWPGHHKQTNALLQPESRAAFQRLLDAGWTDSLRTLQPEGPLWTFWGYLRHRWPNDKGMRLDHLLLSPDLAPSLRAAGVDRDVRGQDGASDHAPAWVELKQGMKRPPCRAPTALGAKTPRSGARIDRRGGDPAPDDPGWQILRGAGPTLAPGQSGLVA